MGWDAYAKGMGDNRGRMLEEFSVAAAKVVANTGLVDGGVRHGQLDCRECGLALQRATGADAWSEEPWDVDMVKRLAASAVWNLNIEVDQRWAYASARAFLETCAILGLSISFSY